MSKNLIQKSVIILAVLFIAFGAARAQSERRTAVPSSPEGGQPQPASFTYQGRLTDASAQASGTFDFQFALFRQAAGGAEIAAQSIAGVSVVSGVFTVELDFGAAAFSGEIRYLEIRVKRPTDANHTTLTPRQLISSAPYATRALAANFAQNAAELDGSTADEFARANDPRLTDSREPRAGSGNYIQNTTTAQESSNFNISGDGKLGGALSANSVNSTVGYSIGNNLILRIPGTNNLFAGVNSGLNTTGSGNTFLGRSVALNNTTGSDNTFLGRAAGSGNYTGNNNTLVGVGANVGEIGLTFATAIGAGATVGRNNTVVLGRTADTVIAPNLLRVGALGAAGSTQLCRNADNEISFCSSSLRYKTDIAPFSLGLDLVKRLQPISFGWRADGTRDVGFGAEDVARVNPLFVQYNRAGEVEGIKYDRLSVVFVNAIREQQAQIERQQKQINELKQLVCALKPEAEICR